MGQSFSTNTGLSALPEYPQEKDPSIYAELLRIRNAFQVLQSAIDGLGGAGGAVVTHPAALTTGAIVVGQNNAGAIATSPALVSSLGDITVSGASGVFLATTTALTNGAGAGAGTLTNAPSAGNPTKWIEINDAGTIRKIPTWT